MKVIVSMFILVLASTPAFAEETMIGALGGLPFLVLMFVIMYFLLIRPQQKRAKEHKLMLGELKKGDEVVTNGGVLGKIKSIDDNYLTLEIAENVVVKVQKPGINQRLPKGSI